MGEMAEKGGLAGAVFAQNHQKILTVVAQPLIEKIIQRFVFYFFVPIIFRFLFFGKFSFSEFFKSAFFFPDLAVKVDVMIFIQKIFVKLIPQLLQINIDLIIEAAFVIP